MDDKIIIPMRLPGLNEILDAALRNRYEYGKMKKEYSEAVAWIAKPLRPIKRAYFDFTWYEENRRRDIDNVAVGRKFILDGIQLAERLTNDGWKQIAGFTDSFEVDPKNPRVEVKIRRL